MAHILSLDPGFGNTKIASEKGTVVIQSAVAHPRPVGLAAQGLDIQSRPQTVTFADGRTFVTGPGAWAWGEPLSTLDFADLTSPQRRALFYAAVAKVLEPGNHEIDGLVVGLPVPVLQDELQGPAVMAGMGSYKGVHEFSVDEYTYRLEIKKIRGVAQPLGAYANWILDDAGHIRQGANSAEVAILDIGMNTVDFYVIQNWKVAPRFVGGGKLGIRRLLENMNGRGHDLEELDAALRRGQLRPDAEQLSVWLGAILAGLADTWPRLDRFSAVIPAGGGATVLGEMLRTALVNRKGIVYWPEDPVTANVIGFYKWGCRVFGS